ncbi:hypothetical protein ANN_21116 [Periplaneta americana]|uniref:Uncharacterized protein n=1 Tax=Periplaneta americana TaxID=6978 RepID=A0ABQ8SFD2_PERAM|nr:hypothetical protein ANN_21116 [Periplaneta americana]
MKTRQKLILQFSAKQNFSCLTRRNSQTRKDFEQQLLLKVISIHYKYFSRFDPPSNVKNKNFVAYQLLRMAMSILNGSLRSYKSGIRRFIADLTLLIHIHTPSSFHIERLMPAHDDKEKCVCFDITALSTACHAAISCSYHRIPVVEGDSKRCFWFLIVDPKERNIICSFYKSSIVTTTKINGIIVTSACCYRQNHGGTEDIRRDAVVRSEATVNSRATDEYGPTVVTDEDGQDGRIHYQQDGTPSHYRSEVRELLHRRFPVR